MIGDRLLVDTNSVIAFLNGDSRATAVIGSVEVVVLCAPVYGELYFGALKSTRISENLANLQVFIENSEFLNIDGRIAEEYARLRIEQRRKGKPLPGIDLWIAASARQRKLPLLTLDSHFLVVDGLDLRRF